MRVTIAALAFGACTPPPPVAPVANESVHPPPLMHPTIEHFASAPRPELDIAGLEPDFHDLLRWPLSAMSHPTLEPRFNIAAVFAAPGVDWMELCKQGAQNRSLAGRQQDEQQYLRGWCHVLAHDVDLALGNLVPLLGSTVAGLPAAVRLDIANVIVDGGDADKAEHWLTRYRIDDPATLDTLVAAYVEIGRDPDAAQINARLLGMSVTPADDVACRRLTKQIVLGPQGARVDLLGQLETKATLPKVPDTTCVELFHAVRCWTNPAENCSEYLYDVKLEYRYAFILWLAYRWPLRAANEDEWLQVADHALRAIPIVPSETAFFTALDAAQNAHPGCSKSMLHLLDRAAQMLSLLGVDMAQRVLTSRQRCLDYMTKLSQDAPRTEPQ